MMRLAIIAALGLALAGCSDSPRIIEAKKAVAERFAYPGATEFRDVREVARGVCGQANGRRVNGEMSGFRRFYWSTSSGATVEAMGSTGDAQVDLVLAHMDDSTISLGCK